METQETKTCTRCGEAKTLDQYRIDPRNGKPKPRCTPCLNAQDAARFASRTRGQRDRLNSMKRTQHSTMTEVQRERFTARQADWFASLTREELDKRNAAKRERYHAARGRS